MIGENKIQTSGHAQVQLNMYLDHAYRWELVHSRLTQAIEKNKT